MTTPILGIAEVAQGQSNKETTINDAIRALENATQKMRSATATAPTNLSAANYTGFFYHRFTGTPGAWTLNVPATQRAFYVENDTNGIATVQVTGGAGESVEIAVGEGRLLYCDGADILEIGGGAGGTGGGAEAHMISCFFAGDGVDENQELVYIFTRAVDFATNLPDARAYAQVAPATGSVTFGLEKNGASIGSFASAVSTQTATFTVTATAFAIGDRLHITCPATFDDLAGVAVTLVGEVA